MSSISDLHDKLISLNLSLNELSAKDITRVQQALISINNSLGAKYVTQNDTSDIITCQSNCCQSNCCQADFCQSNCCQSNCCQSNCCQRNCRRMNPHEE